MTLIFFSVLIVNIFVIFSLLRDTKKDESSHLFKMEAMQSSLEQMQQKNGKLKIKNRIAADFESDYKTYLNSFLEQIFDVQHLFLSRITKNNQ
ncbi:hypothetical protein [Flavobacterium sp.]|uniref:hypothetical protein n=1 Tax=Flavobacterium sp. TaxID=239 RepID=UPI0028BDC52A|nr:hypothetical protein [Flavobacterium sp.]